MLDGGRSGEGGDLSDCGECWEVDAGDSEKTEFELNGLDTGGELGVSDHRPGRRLPKVDVPTELAASCLEDGTEP